MKASSRTKKGSLLSDATYLFIFAFGNVGGKSTIFWLPALQRENKRHSESSDSKTTSSASIADPMLLTAEGSESSVVTNSKTYELEFLFNLH